MNVSAGVGELEGGDLLAAPQLATDVLELLGVLKLVPTPLEPLLGDSSLHDHLAKPIVQTLLRAAVIVSANVEV